MTIMCFRGGSFENEHRALCYVTHKGGDRTVYIPMSRISGMNLFLQCVRNF
jgi:hypothetical protein